MFQWTLPQVVCVLSVCSSLALGYEDDIEVNYADTYYNEITEEEPQLTTPSPTPCRSSDLTKWDKVFSMLENSQMRENMLLQYANDIIKVEMGSLRGEMLRFVAQYGGSCGSAVETAGRRISLQLDNRLRETLERFNLREDRNAAITTENSAGSPNNQEALLQQLLSAVRAQASRVAKLESSCFNNPRAAMGMGAPSDSKMGFQLPVNGGQQRQEVISPDETRALESILTATVTELKQTRAELEHVLRSTRQRYLPAGCETALLFPMRSRRIYTSVVPDVPLSLSSFTVCLWAQPAGITNKTVLFSYGTRRNPYEIQLFFSGTSALFTVGGEAHLVEGRGVVKAGASEWVHLCGVWMSEQGLASLWANGIKVASTPGVAEGHTIPDGGSVQLGQERNGCCSGSPSMQVGSGMQGFEGGFDPKMAFAGKMTGVNLWDRALTEEEISKRALRESQSCDSRGNVVAWGLTEMIPHGGAQFII
ncbi:pentraxin-related protein PTX3 [Lampris incognitus]|uniref:pentraxin-related protein PTX3 n=1 Tax=Lampris incognitus TaxID=2546036 RepID=UPI0024B61895|nr:pentraxin-related protein PTX3 [Lampris incognitus]